MYTDTHARTHVHTQIDHIRFVFALAVCRKPDIQKIMLKMKPNKKDQKKNQRRKRRKQDDEAKLEILLLIRLFFFSDLILLLFFIQFIRTSYTHVRSIYDLSWMSMRVCACDFCLFHPRWPVVVVSIGSRSKRTKHKN